MGHVTSMSMKSNLIDAINAINSDDPIFTPIAVYTFQRRETTNIKDFHGFAIATIN